MKQFTPKLFDVLKTSYSKEPLFKDIIAGIIVAIIALPLSIALALAGRENFCANIDASIARAEEIELG